MTSRATARGFGPRAISRALTHREGDELAASAPGGELRNAERGASSAILLGFPTANGAITPATRALYRGTAHRRK